MCFFKNASIFLLFLFFKNMNTQIGIFSGSFNPVHIGHVALANYITEFTYVDEVWFLVSPHNPLKEKKALADAELRFEMTKIALSQFEKLHASDFEFSLPRPSYTIHTLEELQRQFPEKSFTLIIGGDNWTEFHRWKAHERLRSEYKILIYPRLGKQITLDKKYRNNVMLCHAPIIEISSTFIRQSIVEGKNMCAFVPHGVYDFIEREGLYR